MENTLITNEFELYSIPELCNKNYFIPDYQRGYRWENKQVEQLLDDLYTFCYDNDKSGFYCLQPIVVKELTKEQIEKFKLESDIDDNRWYEVIDGQQRLTTIRIIIAIMDILTGEDNGKFNIYYQTRPFLRYVFESLVRSNDKKSIELNQYGNGLKLDIDAWCVLHAANVIHSYKTFVADNYRSFKGRFSEFFLNNGTNGDKLVQVIWYELKDGTPARDVFNRLNKNKIGLTNSELIRAMFLSESSIYNCNEDEKLRKQMHIVEKWDEMEHKLRDDKFWSFITNVKTEKYSNRIELLFDFISKKYAKEEKEGNKNISKEDNQYTYLYFDSLIKNEEYDLWTLWMQIEKYYSIIMYWYENFDFYHKIGYLINMNNKEDIIPELIEQYAKKNKKEFEEKVVDSEIKKIVDVNLYNLSYRSKEDEDKDKDKEKIYQILSLYNVELCRNKSNRSYGRFPFDKFKAEKWTLEHIHAQNSEGINQTKTDAWYKWLDENIQMLERLAPNFKNEEKERITISYLIEELKATKAKEKNKISFKEIDKEFNEVLSFFDSLNNPGDPNDMDKLSNMTLLSGSVNTAVGNMVFEGKRQRIVELDSKGDEYIPIGTKRVFLKYHNINADAASVVQQMYFWGQKDRENYMEDIINTLSPYLNKNKI